MTNLETKSKAETAQPTFFDNAIKNALLVLPIVAFAVGGAAAVLVTCAVMSPDARQYKGLRDRLNSIRQR